MENVQSQWKCGNMQHIVNRSVLHEGEHASFITQTPAEKMEMNVMEEKNQNCYLRWQLLSVYLHLGAIGQTAEIQLITPTPVKHKICAVFSPSTSRVFIMETLSNKGCKPGGSVWGYWSGSVVVL